MNSLSLTKALFDILRTTPIFVFLILSGCEKISIKNSYKDELWDLIDASRDSMFSQQYDIAELNWRKTLKATSKNTPSSLSYS